MKSTKKLLVAIPVLALFLSGCSFKEVKHSIGESWIGQHILHPVYDPVRDLINGGKNKEEKKECTHQDANHDGVCDLCGVSGLAVEHTDENHDHKCDVCGAEVSVHKDENSDFVCDICGEALETVSVVLDTSEATLNFALNSEFDTEGVKVIATSSVGSKKELEFTVSKPDMSTTGEKTVVVTYGTGENEKFEYTINVSYWTEEDLEVFEAGSFTGYAPLPYLPGMHTVAEWEGEEDEKELVSWSIMLEDVSAADYLAYYSALQAYNAVVQFDGQEEGEKVDVTFALTEIGIEDADGYHDLTDVAVFALIPSYVDDEEYGHRGFLFDEYLILGVNKEGSLVVESRLINAMLDAYFFGDIIADGEYGFSAKYNSYVQYLPDQIYNYYSEYSYLNFVYPPFEGASFNFVPMSLFSLYPLDEDLDVFDLAWEVELDYATENDLNAFYASFEEYGYEATEHPATEDFPYAYVTYTLEDEFAGYMSYDVFYFEASGSSPSAIIFDFYYIAPEQYTNHLSPVAKAICQILGAGEDLEIDDSYYEWFECSIGEFYGSLEGVESGEELIINYGRLLVELGFNVIEEIYYTEGDEESSGYYEITMGDEDYTFTMYVEDTANEDGAYLVEFDLFDQYLDASISKVEAEGQSIHDNAFGFKGLRGVDYIIETDEDDNEFVTAVAEYGPAPEEGLDEALADAANEVATACLPESYIVASEELDSDNSTFTLICQDIERGFEVTFVSSVEEGEIVVDIKIESKTFITPKTVIVDFLTALNGSEPSADDYVISEEDKSATAELVIEDAEASAEGLAAVATDLAAKFGESFVAGTPEAGEEDNTVVLTLANEVSGIDAQILVGLGEESGYVATVYVEFHVEPVTGMSPLEAITDFASWFNGQTAEVEEGVYGTYGFFQASSISVDALKGYVANLFVPDEFTLAYDWEESQGAEVCYYVNPVGTVLEIYVYSDVVYVDGEGYIVDEGTEGATPVDVTCIEVYSYTASN